MVMVDKRRSNEEIESKKKKKKTTMRDEGEGGGINSLPDSILHQVLSFLTMKQAIRTSLVSKRWRYLWTCTPSLNFTRGKDRDDQRFMEFVDTVLILRDGSCNIQRFSISTETSYDHHSYYSNSSSPRTPPGTPPSPHNHHHHHDDYHSHSDSDSDSDSDAYSGDRRRRRSLGLNSSSYLNSAKILKLRLDIWILSAIKRNVEEIHIEINFGGSVVELPHCLFTCNSLKKLELISLDKDPHPLILPNSITLPRLQSLHLGRLLLHFEGDDKIDKFLSNCCHGLESLTLSECGIHRTNLNINAPNLKHLVIKETYSKELEHGGITGSVRIYAPNLISFDCADYLLKNYYLENVSSLVEAYIRMTVGSKAQKEAGVQEKGRNAMICGDKINFRILHNVKHLQLSSWAFQIFIATYGLLDSGNTGFDNLVKLSLNTWLSRDCIRGITCLLNMSPNIVKLSLNITEDTITPIFPRWDKIKLNLADIGDYWKLPLQCVVLDHLKIVEIQGLEGRINELKFLEVLLKNAVVLEQLVLTFFFDSSSGRERLKEYNRILQLFPRASSSLTIVFI